MALNLSRIVERHAQFTPQQVALHWHGQDTDYRALWQQVDASTSALLAAAEHSQILTHAGARWLMADLHDEEAAQLLAQGASWQLMPAPPGARCKRRCCWASCLAAAMLWPTWIKPRSDPNHPRPDQ